MTICVFDRDEQRKLHPEWEDRVGLLHSTGVSGTTRPRAAHQTLAGAGKANSWRQVSSRSRHKRVVVSRCAFCRASVRRRDGARAPWSSSWTSWPWWTATTSSATVEWGRGKAGWRPALWRDDITGTSVMSSWLDLNQSLHQAVPNFENSLYQT